MQEQSIALTNVAHDNPRTHQRQSSSQTNVASLERAASIVAGSLLSMYGLRRPPFGLLLALVGGELIYRGVSGQCPVYKQLGISTTGESEEQHVTKAITINRPAADLYHHWHNVESLPSMLQHIEQVEHVDPNHLHWVANGPFGMRLAWDTTVADDVPDSELAWRSVPDAPIAHASNVSFVPAPGNRGTEVRMSLRYRLPGGALGTLAAKALATQVGMFMTDELRHFKQLIETGQIPRNQGQIPDQQADQSKRIKTTDEVLKGSQDSFPASDPPAWMAGNQEKQS